MSDVNNDPVAQDVPQSVTDSVDGEQAPAEAGADVPQDEARGSSEIDGRVAAVSSERDQYKDALQRLQADFENFRKRMNKQQLEGAERANEGLVQKILPVLDTIELAKAHEPSGSIEQVSVALLEVLTKEGLERIDTINAAFDPNLHDAVAHEPGDGDPQVSEELRAGYRWKGRVLRPAMVKVVG